MLKLNLYVTNSWAVFRFDGEKCFFILTRTSIENENRLVFSACYGVLRFIMESGAQGCEIVVSGKLRGQRAKAMKFIDGLMIHSGDPVNDYVQYAVRHVLLRQGVLGIKVKIMLPYQNKDGAGAKKPLPDHISIVNPKDETAITHPHSEQKDRKNENVRKTKFSERFFLFNLKMFFYRISVATNTNGYASSD